MTTPGAIPQPLITFDPARAGDFELQLSVGDRRRPDGLTRATLDGTGHISVDHEGQEGVAPTVQGSVPGLDAQSALRQATHFPWNQPSLQLRAVPDEPVVKWLLSDKPGNKTVMLTLWLRDAESNQSMSPVLAMLRAQVERLTANERFL